MREYATMNSDRLLSRGGLLSRHSEVSPNSIRRHHNIKVNHSSINHRRSIKGSHSSINHRRRSIKGSRNSISHRRSIRVSPSSIRHRRSIKGSHNSISVNHQCIRVILILWLSRIRISSTDSLRIRISRSIGKLRRRSTDKRLLRSTEISRLKRDRLSSTGKRKNLTWHQNSCSG